MLASLTRRAPRIAQRGRQDRAAPCRLLAAACRAAGRDTPESVGGQARQAYRLVNRHVPMELAVRMLLKPLRLRPGIQRAVMAPLATLGHRVVLR